jgi:hypothetical protein
MAVTAHWNDALPADAHSATASGFEPDHPASDLAHASVIGAVAAAIAIPYMDAGTAMAFAEAHNIVCHLTSLVLVDQAGEVMDSLPAQRKVPLMSPATVQVSQPAGRPALRQTINADAGRQSLFGTTTGAFRRRTAFVVASAPVRRPKARACEPAENASAVQSAMTQTLALLKSWVGRIDWSNAEALRQGDTSALDPQLVALIMSASRTEAVEELARTVGASSVAVVIALLARASAGNDRNAARVFRAVLGGADPDQMHAAAQAMGL